MAINRTAAATKVKNAIKYFEGHIPSPSNIKICKLLQLANEYAIKNSGVPVTWLTEDESIAIDLEPVEEFDDSSFCDYEIDLLDLVIKRYGNYRADRLSSIKPFYENAYQSFWRDDLGRFKEPSPTRII